MTTTINVEQTKTVEVISGDYVYRLNTTVTVIAGGIEPETFLYRMGATEPQDTFEHTCTLGDMVTYENTRAAAEIAHDDFYRKSTTVDLDYEELQLALTEAALQLTRLQSLVTDWEAYEGNWSGTTDVDITAS